MKKNVVSNNINFMYCVYKQSRAHLVVYLHMIWIIIFRLSKYFTSAELTFAVTMQNVLLATGIWHVPPAHLPLLPRNATSDILFCNQKS